MTTAHDVLEFWFPPDQQRANKLWWGKDPALDDEIRQRFAATLSAAKAGELDDWAQTPTGRIALIIVLDQLSRNIHRGSAETYAADEQARALTAAGLALRHDRALPPIQRLFFYMPLEHSESLDDQQRCVALMEALATSPDVPEDQRPRFAGFVDYAVRHRDIVARFGRFPHRNELLDRVSTDQELDFLSQPGSSF